MMLNISLNWNQPEWSYAIHIRFLPVFDLNLSLFDEAAALEGKWGRIEALWQRKIWRMYFILYDRCRLYRDEQGISALMKVKNIQPGLLLRL